MNRTAILFLFLELEPKNLEKYCSATDIMRNEVLKHLEKLYVVILILSLLIALAVIPDILTRGKNPEDLQRLRDHVQVLIDENSILRKSAENITCSNNIIDEDLKTVAQLR